MADDYGALGAPVQCVKAVPAAAGTCARILYVITKFFYIIFRYMLTS